MQDVTVVQADDRLYHVEVRVVLERLSRETELDTRPHCAHIAHWTVPSLALLSGIPRRHRHRAAVSEGREHSGRADRRQPRRRYSRRDAGRQARGDAWRREARREWRDPGREWR